MIQIKFTQKPVKVEKRYNIATVAKAIGKTEGAVSGYFSNRGVSTRSGITLEQIAEVCKARTRGASVKWEDVAEIRKRLEEEQGIQIVDDDSTQTKTEGE